MDKLLNQIKYLIGLKREGDFWDYKEKWHSHNERLIHDIICFANTVHEKDCYIIIGVSDNGDIIGLQEEERKKQADLINTLNSYPFSRETPNIKLEHIEIGGKGLDILIIPNSYSVPYFLKRRGKNYDVIKQGLVYSRIGDTNTPINESADFTTIESLWKKRLGLNKTVLERLSHLLNNPIDWVKNETGYFHTFSPEYTLEYGEIRCGDPMFYSYCMDNEDTSYQNINLKFNDTVLIGFDTAILDSGRYRVITPEFGFFAIEGEEKFSYRYYIVNSLRYKVNDLLFNLDREEEVNARRNFFEVILLFNSDGEKETFMEYVQEHQKQFIGEILGRKDEYYSTNNEGKKRQIKTGKVLVKMLDNFRKEKLN
ncbi:AlbA family DNA-binding domain-containing protein [Bacillus subtilis]|uniref:AlbA family DNA-binding domain-containing protein n=1 Tax=Bacillus subtilis TaxID=1423 RepID=UPI000DC3D37B|nr:ATP-binding protein [Bacillus subtilis]MDI6587216.1 ATP-binding protein [Bacillus subtilis]MDM5457977.1 ATP-binding protein [Bacillus subtilis]QGI05134.1 ATP-binding protein [Bacillus subtilis]RAP10688.1 hypothetical protein HS3_01107 [Bacillus subtilis]